MGLPPVVLGRQTVVAVKRTAGDVDTLGVAAQGLSRLTVRGCSFQPVQTPEEVLGAEDRLISRWVLYCPPGTDLVGTDAVEVDGISYEVDGDPQTWSDAAGRPQHVEVWLRRARG